MPRLLHSISDNRRTRRCARAGGGAGLEINVPRARRVNLNVGPIGTAMIRCIPKGLCSWNFDIDANGHSASVEFNWVGEQGAITIDGEPHDVRKHGAFSGHWTMDSNSKTVATAQKSSVFTRSFELTTSSGSIVLRARSAFGRTMLLEGAGFDAVIAPIHSFTRRASIAGNISDFRIACFAFWLTVLLWRRAAKSD